MRILEIITKKRLGEELSADELAFLVRGAVDRSISDAQLSAFLMACCCRGLSLRETTELTLSMAHSGAMLDLSACSIPPVDKHSTGGVGDKTTLVVAPMVAACGVPVAKMSGHGLGFTGGTLDKLSAIPGLDTTLTKSQFMDVLNRVGFVVAGQSADLAPADGRLYALRDETATVESVGLIASSILSKKLAVGARVIVIDVKVGAGALMKTAEAARELAELLVRVGANAGLRVVTVLSNMEQPLGKTIGNALELREALAVLHGQESPDLWDLSLALGSEMLVGAGITDRRERARELLVEAVQSGAALRKFQDYVEALGGDGKVVQDPDLLPQAPYKKAVLAAESGFVANVDAEKLGWVAMTLGAGCEHKGRAIDTTVGLELLVKIGDSVTVGQPLVVVHAQNESDWAKAADGVLSTYRISPERVSPSPLIKDRINIESLR